MTTTSTSMFPSSGFPFGTNSTFDEPLPQWSLSTARFLEEAVAWIGQVFLMWNVMGSAPLTALQRIGLAIYLCLTILFAGPYNVLDPAVTVLVTAFTTFPLRKASYRSLIDDLAKRAHNGSGFALKRIGDPERAADQAEEILETYNERVTEETKELLQLADTSRGGERPVLGSVVSSGVAAAWAVPTVALAQGPSGVRRFVPQGGPLWIILTVLGFVNPVINAVRIIIAGPSVAARVWHPYYEWRQTTFMLLAAGRAIIIGAVGTRYENALQVMSTVQTGSKPVKFNLIVNWLVYILMYGALAAVVTTAIFYDSRSATMIGTTIAASGPGSSGGIGAGYRPQGWDIAALVASVLSAAGTAWYATGNVGFPGFIALTIFQMFAVVPILGASVFRFKTWQVPPLPPEAVPASELARAISLGFNDARKVLCSLVTLITTGDLCLIGAAQ
ncbi:hypothetical protein HK102_012702 [Quaeritorhiza haematococci]|nr:hypothetical protein HK102_012702 [Quaeritorhiza haematococci]